MYQLLLNLWVMGRITEIRINNAIAKGYITTDEKQMILATPQIV